MTSVHRRWGTAAAAAVLVVPLTGSAQSLADCPSGYQCGFTDTNFTAHVGAPEDWIGDTWNDSFTAAQACSGVAH